MKVGAYCSCTITFLVSFSPHPASDLCEVAAQREAAMGTNKRRGSSKGSASRKKRSSIGSADDETPTRVTKVAFVSFIFCACFLTFNFPSCVQHAIQHASDRVYRHALVHCRQPRCAAWPFTTMLVLRRSTRSTSSSCQCRSYGRAHPRHTQTPTVVCPPPHHTNVHLIPPPHL